jgi:hypothetical protein
MEESLSLVSLTGSTLNTLEVTNGETFIGTPPENPPLVLLLPQYVPLKFSFSLSNILLYDQSFHN